MDSTDAIKRVQEQVEHYPKTAKLLTDHVNDGIPATDSLQKCSVSEKPPCLLSNIEHRFSHSVILLRI